VIILASPQYFRQNSCTLILNGPRQQTSVTEINISRDVPKRSGADRCCKCLCVCVCVCVRARARVNDFFWINYVGLNMNDTVLALLCACSLSKVNIFVFGTSLEILFLQTTLSRVNIHFKNVDRSLLPFRIHCFHLHLVTALIQTSNQLHVHNVVLIMRTFLWIQRSSVLATSQ